MAGRAGFSLIELTVAILLLDVGVLALAATAAGVVRLTAAGGREGSAALVAAGRLEALRVMGCGPDSGGAAGADSVGRFLERWSVAPDGPGRMARVIVSYADGAGLRSAESVALFGCAP